MSESTAYVLFIILNFILHLVKKITFLKKLIISLLEKK